MKMSRFIDVGFYTCVRIRLPKKRYFTRIGNYTVYSASIGVQLYLQFFVKEPIVIARVWHGYTLPEHADAYESMLKPELLPGISTVNGYRGGYLLRREAAAETEFITIMLWDSIDAIRAVAGPDYETAIIPEERRRFLFRYDTKSAHYNIASIDNPSGQTMTK